MRQINRIRIVVGFPADAKRGRQILAEVTKFGFIRQLCLHRGVDLDLVAWDTHAGPGIHDDGVQGWIDLALQICDCDLFVAVFRSNLGTSFSKGKSGTVYEIESAIKSYRESKSPQVWVCFPHDFKDDSDNSNEDLSKELQEYIRFVRDNSQEYPIAYLEYSSWIELTDHFSSWLFKFIFSKTDSESQGSPQIAPGNQTKLFYTVNSEITQVPVESLTCPVGNIDITFVACSERKDAFKWHGRIVVYLNSTITSPLIGKFSLTTLTVLTTAESTGQWIPQSRCSGVQSGANAIEFEVTVTFDGAPNSARLVVENLFANANLLGMSSTRQPTTISAYVTATSFDSTVFPLVGKNLQGQVASLYVVFNIS